MVKILPFQNKGEAASDQEFLTDRNETLLFRPTEGGGMSLGNLNQPDVHNLFSNPERDWSNQELADLFRVRQLLSSANVPVETDRGITDEGDPWFVFCQPNGEVFIHLCRIGGTYYLDSPNVLRPLRGGSFDALIADFTNKALPAHDSEDQSERRVIRLERGGKIRLHPSAMLAALIWTLYLASEELVLPAPEENAFDGDALLTFDSLFSADALDDTTVNIFGENDDAEMTYLLKHGDAEVDEVALDAQGQLRDVAMQQQGLAIQNNAFTMGLSTIAIAMGFMSETVLLDNQRKVLEGLKALGITEHDGEARQTAEVDIPADAEGNDILAMLANFMGLDLSLNVDRADQTATADTQQELAHLTEEGLADEAIIGAQAASKDVMRDKSSITEKDVQTTSTEVLPDAESFAEEVVAYVPAAEAAQANSSGSFSKIIQSWQPLMEELQLGKVTIKTSFDISKTDASTLFKLIDFAADQRTTGFREFDRMAEQLIEFLEAKDGELGIIELENEIIMIDRTAVTGGQTEYINWETADGKIISLVGLASDFAQFDMIA